VEGVAGVQVNELIGVLKIAVGEQHGRAKETVAQEGAAIATAYEGASEVGIEAAAIVGEKDAARVRRAIERASANQRRESADWDIRECGVERGSERVAGEGFGDGCVEIGVSAASTKSVAEICVESDFET